jgi:hypothetical protein
MTEKFWLETHKSLKEFYESGGIFDKKTGKYQYDPNYYSFDKYELEIDPSETLEDVEKYDSIKQQKEIIKCCNSFSYFCHKYIRILHPMKGLIPFVLFNYQRKVIKDYEKHRFNIISKFRQGGLTTVTLLYGLWKCMFQMDQQIMLISKTDREATDAGLIIDRACENLPLWIKPKKNEGKWNDHLKMFTDTGSAIKFYSPEAARGKSVTFLIIDEAAFIDDMDKHWKSMWPVLSTGGSCALISTVNGLGNWYEQTYRDSKENKNKFHVIDLDFWEHPDYNDEEWIAEQKAQLGEKGFLQEILREFLGSGETYFPAKVITDLTEQTRNNYPSRKLFAKWANTSGRMAQLENEQSKGAMWVWKEPVEGREYIIGADCAEGQGENNDNSCFQIIDSITSEQVAEFYSNTVVPHEFAQVLNEVGTFYNNALIAVENMGPGGAVISNLQHTLYYENLYYDTTKITSSTKPGIKMGQTNRPLFLESLQNKLLNKSMLINSIRFVTELQTFEYNPTTKKAQAQKGKHDDAIMSMAIALYVRETLNRDLPLGIENSEGTSIIKSQVYEEIKKELEDGIMESLMEEEEIDLLASGMDTISSPLINTQRKGENILKEFGW